MRLLRALPREHQLRSNLFATALLGSTGALGKLANCRSLSSILTDVAADMPNLRDTRITRETRVDHEARITRPARVERGATVTRNKSVARRAAVIHERRDVRKSLGLPAVWPVPRKQRSRYRRNRSCSLCRSIVLPPSFCQTDLAERWGQDDESSPQFGNHVSRGGGDRFFPAIGAELAAVRLASVSEVDRS